MNEVELRRMVSARLHIVCGGAGAECTELSVGSALERGNALLEEIGVGPTEKVVLLLLPHSVELFCLHLALVFRGNAPGILPWPTSRVDPAKYQRNLIHQLRGLPAARLITVPALANNLAGKIGFPASAVPGNPVAEYTTLFGQRIEAELADTVTRLSTPAQDLPEDTLFLQFSGGTTGTQKCVVVTERMFRSQMDRLQGALQFGEKDSVVSWLPLYHDMGLIACLWLPVWCGATGVHIGASDWLLGPEKLFSLIERYHGTFCWLPNFAFSYLAQRKPGMRGSWKLGSMRAWISCSEPVRKRSIDEFVTAFGEWGVEAGSVQSSYAMAETVFAISQSDPGRPPQVVKRGEVEAGSDTTERLAFRLSGDTFVSSGALLAETEVRIVSDGNVCAEGMAGEIELRSSSLFDGYWGAGGFQKDCFTSDGWYRTGDYGFLLGAEIFVVGRVKDLIIVGGQNFVPEDVETVVNEVEGVYPGRVVAFAMEDEIYGTQSIAVVAEMRPNAVLEPVVLEKEIRSRVLSAIGVAPRFVRAVPERWIVKSTAGKISRKETREKYMQEWSVMRLKEKRHD